MVAERAPRRLNDPLRPHASTCTAVDEIDGKGRGVVATRRIARGELIERVPVVVVPAAQYAAVSATVLDGYVYDWGQGEELAVALGHGSLYNHSFEPNVVYTKHLDVRLLEYRALRDVEAGEELLINYNGDVDDKTPMRFEVQG
jgi:uncharacterized protein